MCEREKANSGKAAGETEVKNPPTRIIPFLKVLISATICRKKMKLANLIGTFKRGYSSKESGTMAWTEEMAAPMSSPQRDRERSRNTAGEGLWGKVVTDVRVALGPLHTLGSGDLYLKVLGKRLITRVTPQWELAKMWKGAWKHVRQGQVPLHSPVERSILMKTSFPWAMNVLNGPTILFDWDQRLVSGSGKCATIQQLN